MPDGDGAAGALGALVDDGGGRGGRRRALADGDVEEVRVGVAAEPVGLVNARAQWPLCMGVLTTVD